MYIVVAVFLSPTSGSGVGFTSTIIVLLTLFFGWKVTFPLSAMILNALKGSMADSKVNRRQAAANAVKLSATSEFEQHRAHIEGEFSNKNRVLQQRLSQSQNQKLKAERAVKVISDYLR
jgi:hypothetical protein